MFTDPESTHTQLSKNVCHAYGSYHESKCHIFRGVPPSTGFAVVVSVVIVKLKKIIKSWQHLAKY